MRATLEERQAIDDLLAEEAESLDSRDWDRWLALFTEDVEFWVPSWDSETVLTADPQGEISLMYYKGRNGLEDRVFRLRTGRSSASTPLPRTCHMTSNVRVARAADGFAVSTRWTASAFRNAETVTYFGSAQYRLVEEAGQLRIAAKKVVVCNDLITTSLDIYNI